MKFAELKDFRRSINALWKRGGRSQKAADSINALLGRIKTVEDPLHGLRLTKNGETRIKNCVKYDLSDYCRLVTVQANGYCILLTCGDHDDVDRWLDAHRGFMPVVGDNGRVVLTYCSSEEVEERRVAGKAGHYVGPLYERLPEEMLDPLLEALPRKIARRIEAVEASTSEAEIWEIVAEIEDSELRIALHDVLSLLRQDRVVDAVARIKLFLGEIQPLEETPLPDIVDSDVIRRINPDSPQFAEALSRFMKTARYRDWMVFMHPDQEAIADEEFDGPAKLIGVSGSGKTCVVVQRAIRLARKYPGQRILVVTLNKALAALIADLIDACVEPEIVGQIEVRAFFMLCRDLLLANDAAAHKLYDEVTWKSREHVDEVWQEFYQCEANNHDARIFQEVHDTLLTRGWDPGPYLRQEVDWVRSALLPNERQGYLTIQRKGRAVPLSTSYREKILKGTELWEDKMRVIGLIDTLGIAQRLANQLSAMQPKYRCVVVDEVQDFGNVELAILRALVAPAPNDLFLCGDGAQAVTSKHQLMRDVGIAIPGHRSRKLTRNYRNSRDVLAAAYDVLLQNLTDEMIDREDLEIIDPEYSATTGATPLLLQGDTLEEELQCALSAAREKIANDSGRKACIAICGFTLYELSRFGESIGLPVLDGATSLEDGSIFLSDLEQTKGFEFDLVCVVNASAGVVPDLLAPEEERYRDLSRLYVAMTRAKTDLLVSWSGDVSPFLAAAEDSFYLARCSDYMEAPVAASMQTPKHLEAFREGTHQKPWREMTGEEFLNSKAAIGGSVQLIAKIRFLIDGVGLRKGRDEMKWRNLGSAVRAYDLVPTSRAHWGPVVGSEFRELASKLGIDSVGQGEKATPMVVRRSVPRQSTPDRMQETRVEIPPEHARLLQLRFRPGCDRGSFGINDWKQLQKFGLWYEALCNGEIKPVTPEQQAFVEFFTNRIDRDPRTNHERVWLAYRERIASKASTPKPKGQLGVRSVDTSHNISFSSWY